MTGIRPVIKTKSWYAGSNVLTGTKCLWFVHLQVPILNTVTSKSDISRPAYSGYPGLLSVKLVQCKKKKKISQLGPLHGSSSPFGPLSRRGLNPIKPVYMTQIGRLHLTACAFNQMGQYTSSPGHRGYCYAELAVFFPSGGHNHRQYSLRLPTEGWPGWVGLCGWLRSEIVYLRSVM